MRVNSSLLPGAGRLANRATPEMGDSDISIPAAILPVISLPEAWQSLPQGAAGSVALAIQTDSGFIQFNRARAAAAALELTRVGNLGPGIWEVDACWSFLYPAAGDSMKLDVGMATPSGSGGNTMTVFQVEATAGIVQGWENRHWRFTVPQNHTLQFDWTLNNASGATPMQVIFAAVVNRLGL